jgi:uncharacterized protein
VIISKYFKSYPDPEDFQRIICYSTKTASKVSIPESVIKDPDASELSGEEKELLFGLGILVNSEQEEKKEILSFVDEVNALNTFFFAKIVMNLDCNLACRYCFEGTRKGRHYMTKETAGLVINFIKENVADMKEIRLTFYGGEPLLSLDLIEYISGAVQCFALDNGRTYSASLITNGTLTTRGNIERLKRVGLRSVSITVDGPEDVHNESRPFKGGKGSYRAIMRNLRAISEIIELKLGGNYTKNNYTRMPELLDRLIEEGLSNDNVSSMQFYPIIQETKSIVEHSFGEGCSTLNEPWMYDAEIFLREELLKRGFKTSRITPVVCMVEMRDRIVINYNGDLYKCAGFLGRKDYSVGDIQNGIKGYRQSHCLNNWKNEKCLSCSYLPLCFGGCRYMKFLRDGNMEGIDCRKPYYDAILETVVRQDIKYGLV